MKQLALSVFAGVGLSLVSATVRAVPLPLPVGAVTVNWTAVQQDRDYLFVSEKVTHNSSATNTIDVYKSSVTNDTVSSADLLALLANSFNTNFSAGAKLGLRGLGAYTVVVLDSTGTNVLLDVSSVFSVSVVQLVHTGSETAITTVSSGGGSFSGNDTEAYQKYVVFNYDDTAMITGDGTHTKFVFSGVLQEKLSQNLGTRKITENVTLSGTGAGTIRNIRSVLGGTLKGTLIGILLVV